MHFFLPPPSFLALVFVLGLCGAVWWLWRGFLGDGGFDGWMDGRLGSWGLVGWLVYVWITVSLSGFLLYNWFVGLLSCLAGW